jgi:hypothetical protein
VKKNVAIKWLSKPTEKDYPAADSYLQLHCDKKWARALVKKLKRAALSKFAAKDILRASGTPIAEIQAFDWLAQHNEVKEGKPLSPLLLVRAEFGRNLIIAGGFHRLCAVFAADQEALVPCKIV